uniref:NADH-ubiquinone oxidoreductase chain 4 n=1 Tax=Platygaster sp. ZJUH_2016026 TaxID=2491166 RepID=A0A3Q8UA07_9HYME|nr:NADH dehydrogenase subunit 4 [Platygaster sp. ZJUH_2016026]
MVELIYMFLFIMIFILLVDKYYIIYLIQNLFMMVIFLLFMFNLNISNWNNWGNLYGNYGMDKVSFLMILLLIWIMILMLMSVYLIKYKYYYLMLLLMMMFSLFGLFYSLDYLMFYLYFEFSLIPIMLMIMGWGYQPERLISVLFMLMYTLFMSLPFLLILMMINNENYSFNLILNKIYKFNLLKNFVIYLLILMIFLVKLPIYLIHLWLPKAHVEAPIFGSMILAGVLLKMGGYGIMRFMFMLININMIYNIMLLSMVMLGSIIISLICMNQIDLKMLIAYSSVVHMGMMLCGGLMMFYWGMMGFMIMMLGHGICSSGLFCLLNMSYKRVLSRTFLMNSGMINYLPKMSLFWFSFSVMNMSAPPSLNLISEIFLMISLIKVDYVMMLLIGLLSFFSGLYSIYLYSYSQHGVNYFFNKFMNNTIDEFMLMILHFIPMNLLVMILWFFN